MVQKFLLNVERSSESEICAKQSQGKLVTSVSLVTGSRCASRINTPSQWNDVLFLIVKWYSVLSVVFFLWYICFTCFCGIMRHGVFEVIHFFIYSYLPIKFNFFVSCNLEANSNAYPKILIFSCQCCRKKSLLLWNYLFWLLLVSVDAPMLLIYLLLVLPF